ncbi:hypothetical protein P8452_66431 [Trifolium repens]|nr:hypothetical protein P8452_66431 [Trifolium repens]
MENLDKIPFSLVTRFVAFGLVSATENAFEVGSVMLWKFQNLCWNRSVIKRLHKFLKLDVQFGNPAEFEWFAPVMKWLLRRWRVTAILCRKFCYGIKTISAFRQVSESSLFLFKRRIQEDSARKPEMVRISSMVMKNSGTVVAG